MNAITSYFNLAPGPRVAGRDTAPPDGPSRPPVLPQYLTLAAGVAAEPFLHRSIANQPLELDTLWKQLAFGLVIAIIVFPAVYRNAFDPDRPLFVQLCAIFSAGIGWQQLFQAATVAVA